MLCGVWAMWRNERWRIPATCIMSFLLLLAPSSTFIPSADFAFEHRLYLPMIPFSVLVAYLLSKMRWRSVVTVLLFSTLAILTIRREAVWSSDAALWEDTVKHAPGKARAWFNLGGAYLKSDPEKARSALQKCLELQPDFVDAWYDLGSLEQQAGHSAKAIAYYQRATEIDPQYWQAWNNTATTLFNLGDREAALQDFERTLQLNPDYWPAQYNIGMIHFMAGRYSDAITKLRIVLDWQPDFREARYALAMSYTRTGDNDAAANEWKKLGGKLSDHFPN